MLRDKAITRIAAAIFTLGALAFAQSTTSSRADFTRRLVAAAVERSTVHVRYVADYVRIPYPGGDVPADTGVCTDEIIRIYRKVGIDLQKEVHEDMVVNFREYPRKWRWFSPQPDTNIDHRRVPNLMVFFRRGENHFRSPPAQRLLARRYRCLGSRRWADAHRNGRGPPTTLGEALHGPAQHRSGPADRGCAV